MKITAIKQQVKRQDRYSVYVDEKYTFSLSEAALVLSGLRKGQELDAVELEKLKQDSVVGKAYDRAIRYVSLRPRSQWEIKDYFRRKGYDEDVARTVLAKLEKLDLVDDAKFAAQWVEWRLNTSNKSRRQLKAELMQKRIDSDLIESALEGIDDQTELSQIKSLIERKQTQSQYQDQQKLMAYLARQGYSYGLIKQALTEEN